MKHAVLSKTDKIRALNDAFRRTFCGGRVMLSPSVAALPNEQKAWVLTAVREFKDFDEGSDPHHEHDFVSVTRGAWPDRPSLPNRGQKKTRSTRRPPA
jgi:hypothetical protein